MTLDRRLAAMLTVVCLAAPTGCRDEPATPPTVTTTTATAADSPAVYVGRDRCVECHARETDLFAGSDHDLAMAPANEDTVLGDFDDTTFQYRDVTSTFFRRDGAFHVTTDGPDGELTDYRVDYTFGVRPLQQYLVEMEDGRLQTLPLCWDARPAAEGGQRWFHIYPGEPIDHRDPLHWTGPYQNWNHMCAECHSTDLVKGYGHEADRFETTYSEIDVSCEACHGPASRHLAWAAEPDDADADPAKGLTVSLRLDHRSLWQFSVEEPTARRTLPVDTGIAIDRCGRCHSRRGQVWPNDRHDGPLADTHRVALLDAGLYHDDGQILDEVYVYGSFLQSRMYHEGVTCRDCHEPHGAKLWATGNELCGRCHKAEVFDTIEHHHHEVGTSGSQCVDCHMPHRNYMVVDPRRDHSFRVPRPDLSVKLGTPNACTDCHDDQTAEWAAQTVGHWTDEESDRSGRFHFGEALHASRTQQPEADALLQRVIDDPEMPAIARATAVSELRRRPGPATPELVARAAGDADPLVRRAAAESLDLLEPQMRIDVGVTLAADPVRTVRLAAASMVAGMPDESADAEARRVIQRAVAEYRDSLAFNADRAESHLNIGNLERALGRAPEAEQAFRAALAIEPGFVPASVNLSDLLRLIGRDKEAVQVLRDALPTTPDNPEVHHALGLALVRIQRFDEALEHLRAAAELRPDNTRLAFVYAIALHDLGRAEDAITALETAQERSPSDRDILFALVNYTMERGRRLDALRWAREAERHWPDDPQVRRMVESLGGS